MATLVIETFPAFIIPRIVLERLVMVPNKLSGAPDNTLFINFITSLENEDIFPVSDLSVFLDIVPLKEPEIPTSEWLIALDTVPVNVPNPPTKDLRTDLAIVPDIVPVDPDSDEVCALAGV